MLSDALVRRAAAQLNQHMCIQDAQALSDHGLECVREVLYAHRHMVPKRTRQDVADGIRFLTGLRLALHQEKDGAAWSVLITREEACQPSHSGVPDFRPAKSVRNAT